jgi:hypothetical protein
MAFGTLTGFSIGLPFLLVGLVLAVMGPLRRRTVVFWPVVIAVAAFIAGFTVVAPISCSTSSTGATSGEVASSTTCTNLVGIDYSRSGSYHPSLVPALVSGGITAVGLGLASRLWLHRRPGANGRNRSN